MTDLAWPVWVWCCGAEDGEGIEFLGPYDDEYTCSDDARASYGHCPRQSYADRGEGNADGLSQVITTSRTHAVRKFEELELLEFIGRGFTLKPCRLGNDHGPNDLRWYVYVDWHEANIDLARAMVDSVGMR